MRGSSVFFLALGDDYGEEEAGPSFEAETFIPVLRRLFARVTVFPFERMLRRHGYFRMNEILRASLHKSEHDLLFCVPFENQIDWEVIAQVGRSTPTATLAWMCDDHWRYEPFSRHIAPAFDYVATTDRVAFMRYLAQPGVRPLLTQWGFDPVRFTPGAEPIEYCVSFVGQRRPHRQRYVTALERAGISVFTRGRGWPSGRVSTEELSGIPARSLLSLNFSDSSTRHINGRTQLKARPFELAGTRTCVVSEWDPQLPTYFAPDVEIKMFRNQRECVRIVRRLLDDTDNARAIATAGWLRAGNDHTYDSRFRSLLKEIGVVAAQQGRMGELCVTN